MSIEYDKLIEQCNKKRSKIYYRLNQITEITGLCPRAAKYRMKVIKKKYKNVPSLLHKVGIKWQIHISIINEFLPKRFRKNRTQNTYGWKNFVTWNLVHDYNTDYHVELIEQIKNRIEPCKLKFTVEQDRRKIKHVHFITDANKKDLTNAVTFVLNTYLTEKEYKLEINDINNKYSAVKYLDKEPLACGLI